MRFIATSVATGDTNTMDHMRAYFSIVRNENRMNFAITIQLNPELKEFLRTAQERLHNPRAVETKDNSYQFENGSDSIDISIERLVFWKETDHTPSLAYIANSEQQINEVQKDTSLACTYDLENATAEQYAFMADFDVNMDIDQFTQWLDDIELPSATEKESTQIEANNETNDIEIPSATKQESTQIDTNTKLETTYAFQTTSEKHVEVKSELVAVRNDVNPESPRPLDHKRFEWDDWDVENHMESVGNGVDYSGAKSLALEIDEAEREDIMDIAYENKLRNNYEMEPGIRMNRSSKKANSDMEMYMRFVNNEILSKATDIWNYLRNLHELWLINPHYNNKNHRR